MFCGEMKCMCTIHVNLSILKSVQQECQFTFRNKTLFWQMTAGFFLKILGLMVYLLQKSGFEYVSDLKIIRDF